MARTVTAHTRGGHVYEAIRAGILAGEFQPGQKLKPNDLRVQYCVSLSVVREALSRLAEQRLVQSQPNQGFQVVPLSEKALRDLTDLRVMVECFALRRAVERGDVTWEADIVAAHHTLAVTPPFEADPSSQLSQSWEQAHRRFHYALIAGCDMPIVLELCSSLFDASQLYRGLVAPLTAESARDVATEHAQIMEAAVARDVEVSAARLELHFRATTKLLLTQLLQVDTHTWPRR
jgi:DNA-binding GntR family transcriptional regulator